MKKSDFINKWSNYSNDTTDVIKQAMMIDLRFVINQAIKDQEEKDFNNTDSE